MDKHEDEKEIRRLVESWALAVRHRDLDAVLAHHADDMIMYDVPKPFQSIGIQAYRNTWDLFFANTQPGVFDIRELTVFADRHVAFCVANMTCANRVNGDYEALDFRLTIGLKKLNGQWTIVHEHHSIPAD